MEHKTMIASISGVGGAEAAIENAALARRFTSQLFPSSVCLLRVFCVLFATGRKQFALTLIITYSLIDGQSNVKRMRIKGEHYLV